jgi:hypothetical protein
VVVQAGDDRPDKHDRQPVSLCYPLLERVRSLLFLVPRATKKCSYPLPLTQRPTAPSVDSLLQAKADMRVNLLLGFDHGVGHSLLLLYDQKHLTVKRVWSSRV